MSLCPEIAEFIAEETHPGRCPLCDGPLPDGRRKYCADPACRELLENLYKMARRERNRQTRAVAP